MSLAVGSALGADPLTGGGRRRRGRGRRGADWDWGGGDVVVMVVELRVEGNRWIRNQEFITRFSKILVEVVSIYIHS